MIETVVIVILAAGVVGLGYYSWQLRLRLWQQRTDYNIRTVEHGRLIADKDQQISKLRQRVGEQSAEKDAAFAKISAKLAETEQCAEDFRREAAYQRALALTLANAAYDATLVVDESLKVIGINESAEALFEVDVQAVGKPLVDVTGLPELDMMVDDALTNQEALLEEQMRIKERNYRVRARVIRREGHVFIALALQDITQLVKLNRARRDMVANISHELRTPIANIRLIIDGLFHEQDKPKRKESISSLRAIARETDNLLWLVQEMSDLAMIESGQAIVKLVDVPLAELVDESIARLEDQSNQKNIKMICHIPDKLSVLCDRDLARRVLVNLLHNAIKWSPVGEAITISAANGSDEITITVLDNGPGVPEEAVERIFERFYQVDASRSGSEGTGLGLAICRHIVEAHGGRIWAESNKDGGGGRFLFTLLSAGEHAKAHSS